MAEEPHALAPVEPARPPDPYEQRYMTGDGLVLYRHKLSAPWQLHAIFAISLAAVFGAALAVGGAAGGAVGIAVGLPMLALVWLLFSVLRVTVSEAHVNVQYGLFGPKIPIAAIEQAEVVQYDWRRFGGWGIRRSLAGEWIYNMPGDGGRAVRIVWRDDRGKRHVTHVGSPRADELRHQIRRAQNTLPASARPSALHPGDPPRR